MVVQWAWEMAGNAGKMSKSMDLSRMLWVTGNEFQPFGTFCYQRMNTLVDITLNSIVENISRFEIERWRSLTLGLQQNLLSLLVTRNAIDSRTIKVFLNYHIISLNFSGK